MIPSLLGLPVEEAVAILQKEGIEPVINVTRAPRDTRTGSGVLRVIRVKGSELTAAVFYDPITERKNAGIL